MLRVLKSPAHLSHRLTERFWWFTQRGPLQQGLVTHLKVLQGTFLRNRVRRRSVHLSTSLLTAGVWKCPAGSFWSCRFEVIPALVVRSKTFPFGRKEQSREPGAATPPQSGQRRDRAAMKPSARAQPGLANLPVTQQGGKLKLITPPAIKLCRGRSKQKLQHCKGDRCAAELRQTEGI